MPVSRRSFLGAIKPGAAAFSPSFVAARGREAFTAQGVSTPAPAASDAAGSDAYSGQHVQCVVPEGDRTLERGLGFEPVEPDLLDQADRSVVPAHRPVA